MANSHTLSALAYALLLLVLTQGCDFGASDGGGEGGGLEGENSSSQCSAGKKKIDGQCRPMFVNIYLNSVLIGPGKVDGTEWDSSLIGTDKISSIVLEGLLTALGYPGAGKVLEFMFNNADVSSLNKPDPMGSAYLAPNGAYDDWYTLELAHYEDTFFLTFGAGTGWTDVPLSKSLKIQIDLTDEDVYNHDPIGSPELNYSDVLDALDEFEVFYVRVDDQTQDQILLVGLSVTAAN